MVNARAVLVYGWRRRAGLAIAGHHYRGWRWSPAMDGLRCQVLPRSDFTSCADPVEDDPRFCRVRLLDPRNKKSSKQWFYSPAILDEIVKHYVW